MRDANKTIGNLIDKANVAIISSVDEEGFPNSKAMLPPRKGRSQAHFSSQPIPPQCGLSTISITRKRASIFLINASSGA